MRYNQIRECDIANGEGIGVALFVQGCYFHCKNCFNQETWDFSGGKPWTKEIRNKFMELVSRPYVRRVSILGGEPLADENVKEVGILIRMIKKNSPEKKIWLYTGYTFEEILKKIQEPKNNFDIKRFITITGADIVVDGKYVDGLQDFKLKWKGSSNQRVIDMTHSFEEIVRNFYKETVNIILENLFGSSVSEEEFDRLVLNKALEGFQVIEYEGKEV